MKCPIMLKVAGLKPGTLSKPNLRNPKGVNDYFSMLNGKAIKDNVKVKRAMSENPYNMKEVKYQKMLLKQYNLIKNKPEMSMPKRDTENIIWKHVVGDKFPRMTLTDKQSMLNDTKKKF